MSGSADRNSSPLTLSPLALCSTTHALSGMAEASNYCLIADVMQAMTNAVLQAMTNAVIKAISNAVMQGMTGLRVSCM